MKVCEIMFEHGYKKVKGKNEDEAYSRRHDIGKKNHLKGKCLKLCVKQWIKKSFMIPTILLQIHYSGNMKLCT